MGLLDAGAEEPKSKALRYVISGVVLALLLAVSVRYFLRYTTEKHTVEHFMHAVVTGDTQQAYQIWHPHASFSYKDFLSFWGPNGYYSPTQELSDRKRGSAAQGRQRRGDRGRDQRVRHVSQSGGDHKIGAKPRSAALGRALRPVDELSPAVGS